MPCRKDIQYDVAHRLEHAGWFFLSASDVAQRRNTGAVITRAEGKVEVEYENLECLQMEKQSRQSNQLMRACSRANANVPLEG